MKKVSIVLSFFNEETIIPEMVRRLRAALDPLASKYAYEIIYVNDESTDGSLALLKEMNKTVPQVKVLNMSRNFGVSQCTIAGMEAATGDAVVIMDADLQDPPELIPALIQEWEKGADVVYTVRTKREGETGFKLFVTKIGYSLLQWFSSIDMPMESGDFKLMTRRVVKQVVQLQEVDPFLRGLVRWVGFKQVPVYYKREGRFGGETHFRLSDPRVLKNFLSGITSFSVKPLYFTFFGGMFISFMSFMYLIAVIVMKLIGWNLPGWSAIMATMLFLGGVQILTIGILGLYIGKVHMQVKSRPNYIVGERIGFED